MSESESERAGDPVNPFELLIVRRAEAEESGADPAATRAVALAEASETLTPEIEKHAKRRFPEGYERHELSQEAWLNLRQLCVSIWDGDAEPPPPWHAYVRRAVRNAGIDVGRDLVRQGVRWLPRSGTVISRNMPNPHTKTATAEDLANRRRPLRAGNEDPVADAVLGNAATDELYRRLQALWANVEAGTEICVFHPAKRCEHLTTGAIGSECTNRHLIFEEVARVVLSGTADEMNPILAARAGYDARDEGSQLHRTVYRCRDWFAWLLIDHGSSTESTSLRRDLEDLLLKHMSRASATTVCILMNDFPDLKIPDDVKAKYGPVHLYRSRGDSR